MTKRTVLQLNANPLNSVGGIQRVVCAWKRLFASKIIVFVVVVCGVIFGLIFSIQRREIARAHRLYAQARAEIQRDGLPLTVDSLVPFKVPESQNAARFYLKVFADYRANPNWGGLEAAALDFPNKPHSALAHQAALDYMRATEPEVKLIEKAVTFPYCDFHYEWKGVVAASKPFYARFRQLARLLYLDAYLLDNEGQPIQALDRLELAAKMAKQVVAEDPSENALLVSCAIYGIIHKEWLRIVQHHPNDPVVLQHALEVNHVIPRTFDLCWSIREEVYTAVALGNELRRHPKEAVELMQQEGIAKSPAKIPWWKQLWERLIGRGAPIAEDMTPEQLDVAEARALDYFHKVFGILKRSPQDMLQTKRALQQLDNETDTRAKAAPSQYLIQQIVTLSPFTYITDHLFTHEIRWWARESLAQKWLYRCKYGVTPSDTKLLSLLKGMPPEARDALFSAPTHLDARPKAISKTP
ncbi:hypothetical protein [Chthonomonas calidirosea]|uniref:hypothetical protein n=1 Tax=Chthonomonas calidirosea TaxID=454171 RepID=UPI000948DFFE|nr:hypothetical protein [Chthonomonas calidirosea]